MADQFTRLLEQFSRGNQGLLLSQGRWGLEKEALRINRDGSLALTPHPRALLDPSRESFFKTDFSESQIELVTPPFRSPEKTHESLLELEEEARAAIGDELLWPLSMPGHLPPDGDIPIARFGNTDEDRLREVYRSGLALRYGKMMQMISGIHYNFSFSESLWVLLQDLTGSTKQRQEFIDEGYFGLARNFLRHRWLLLYLTGASPAADEGYEEEARRKCADFWGECGRSGEEGHYTRHAVSLRTSPFGYGNSPEGAVSVSYDSLAGHVRDLRAALSSRSERFSRLGLFRGEQRVQLNDRVLQLESEYYSPIRFKQTMKGGERQIEALERRGVDHVELRLFDLDPFERAGIGLGRMRFVHAFLVFCLLEESPPLDEAGSLLADHNANLVALAGRRGGLELIRNGHETVPLRKEADVLFEKIRAAAELLDRHRADPAYSAAVSAEYEKISDPSLLPSALIAHEMSMTGETHAQFGLRLAAEARLEHGDFSRWPLESSVPWAAGQAAYFSK